MNEYDRVCRSIGNAEALVAAIAYDAYHYWERAGCPEDFCLQQARLEDGAIIFGSTNRLIWRMESGFRVLPEFCTKRFIDANEEQDHAPAIDR